MSFSTSLVESAVIIASIETLWNAISSCNFTWWKLVKHSEFLDENTSSTIGKLIKLTFDDETIWTIRILGISEYYKRVDKFNCLFTIKF